MNTIIRFTFIFLLTIGVSQNSFANHSAIAPITLDSVHLDSLSYAIGTAMYSDAQKAQLNILADPLFKALNDAKIGKATTTPPQAKQILQMRHKIDSIQLSYAYGILWINVFKQIGATTVNYTDCKKGFVDAQNNSLQVDMLTCQGIVGKHVQNFQKAQMDKQIAANKKFLKANRKKKGMMVTESGLQYEILMEGEGGQKPTASDKVRVHYEGKTLDGRIFDSSHRRGQPAVFGVTQVIRGWIEGLQLMREGATYRFFIPSELAYGQRGQPQAKIAPNSILIFTLELIEVIEK